MLKRHAKRVLVITLGVICILIGLAGLVLPLLQGWFFLAIGALLLSMYSPSLRGFIHRHTERYPHLHKFVERAEGWTTKVFGAPEV